MQLKIANDLSLPIEAVTQTLAAIGRKGAGKTYLATMLAEQMLDREAQVIAIDPVGNWWGLRVGTDGKSKGKDIFVIGGEHGDVPLVPEAGAKIARLLVEKRICAVLDISGFRQGERKRFAAEFAEEFFHLKKAQRSAVHLFVEEAQLFAPQRCGPDEARMLGAFENIIRLGRNYGVGATMVSQRPQSINKEVLSQVECLCVLQVNGTHERKALEDWVQEAGADRKLVGELPGLARGEGYVWSPSWLRVFQRVHFRQKTTFDASATPEVGKAAKAAKLSSIDVEALRESMHEVVAQAEKDDPKALRRQIVELEKQLKQQKPALAETVVQEKLVEVSFVRDRELDLLQEFIGRIEAVRSGLGEELRILAGHLEGVVNSQEKVRANFKTLPAPVKPLAANVRFAPTAPRHRPSGTNGSGESLPAGERATLTAIAQYEDGIDRDSLSVLTGYKRSTRDAYIQRLRDRGYVEQTGSLMAATSAGIGALGPDFEPLPTGEALQEYWRNKLPEGERKVLEILIQSYPRAVSRERIDESTGYKRSSRDAYLQRLSSRRLVESVGRGEVKAVETLF